jgi:membrane protease YdiL (CAAX protease family)
MKIMSAYERLVVKLRTDNTATWYLLILFILSYSWQYVIFITGGVESKLFPFLMFFPAIVAIVFRIITKEGFRKVGWGLRRWWYLLPAIFVPLVFTLGIVFLLEALDWATLSVFIFNNGMVDSKVPLVLGNHTQSIAFFAINLVISFIGICIISSIFTFGEEFGWRGYLQEKLLRKFGLNWGLIILGIIWGYWHLPIILMGYNFPNHPVLGALLLMPISTIFAGIFEGWIYLRSRSIWMPVLVHASGNAAAGILFGGMIMHQNESFRQLIWLAAWGIVAALCLISLNRNKPILWQQPDAHAHRNHFSEPK